MSRWKARLGERQRDGGCWLSVSKKDHSRLFHGHVHRQGLPYMTKVLERLGFEKQYSQLGLFSAGKSLINFSKSSKKKKLWFLRKHRLASPSPGKYRLQCSSFTSRCLDIQWRLVRGMKDGSCLEVAFGLVKFENQVEVFARFRNADIPVSHLIKDVDDVWESQRLIDQIQS